MKNLALTILVLALLPLCSCRKNEFSVAFKLKEVSTQAVRTVYYASDSKKGWLVESVVPLEGKDNVLKGATRLPALLYISPAGSGSADPLVAYVERGDELTVTGAGDNPLTWEVSGNEVNEGWTKWRKENMAALQGYDPAKRNAAVAAYVKKHPDELLSALLLLTEFDTAADETLSAKLWNSLSDKVRTDETVSLAANPDRMALKARLPEKTPSFTLRVRGDSLRKFSTAKAEKTLLWFWESGDPRRDEALDSVRSLKKRAGDKLQVVTVCLDVDSVAWISAMRRDSVKCDNAWEPAGLASKTADRFLVPRTPYFIVTDRTGRHLLRTPKADKLKL